MTKFTKTAQSLLAGLALMAGLGLASSAHAGDVFWSIGMSQPGIHIGVGNLPAPVVVHGPVVVHPRPVYVPPHVVYMPPRPVFYGHPGHYQGHGHDRHHHHHGHQGRGHDRHDHHAHRGGGRGDRGHRH